MENMAVDVANGGTVTNNLILMIPTAGGAQTNQSLNDVWVNGQEQLVPSVIRVWMTNNITVTSPLLQPYPNAPAGTGNYIFEIELHF